MAAGRRSSPPCFLCRLRIWLLCVLVGGSISVVLFQSETAELQATLLSPVLTPLRAWAGLEEAAERDLHAPSLEDGEQTEAQPEAQSESQPEALPEAQAVAAEPAEEAAEEQPMVRDDAEAAGKEEPNAAGREDEEVAAKDGEENLPLQAVLPDAPTTLLGIYQRFCQMGLRSPGSIRLASPETRDAVVQLYQNLVEQAPPAALHRERLVPLKAPNCRDPAWKHILDGTRREVPRVLVDVTTGMGGGPELDLLEIRLLEINASLSHPGQPPPMKDIFVVVESAFGLRGDRKPLHFSRQRSRYKDFLPQIEHILLDNCPKYQRAVEKLRAEKNKKKKSGGKMFSAEAVQRGCVLKTLIERRPEIPDDALLIFSDLDEVPSARAIQMLRHCQPRAAAKEGPWVQAHHPMPYNLRVGCKNPSQKQQHYQGVFTTMGFLRRKKGSLALRYKLSRSFVVPKSGIHLTYVGSRADVDYKLLHHGESGQTLPTKAEAKGKRLNFCEINEKNIKTMEQLMRDNPVSVARAWESKSSPLRSLPEGDLSQCQVPWVLATHPERYPDMWGGAAHVKSGAK